MEKLQIRWVETRSYALGARSWWYFVERDSKSPPLAEGKMNSFFNLDSMYHMANIQWTSVSGPWFKDRRIKGHLCRKTKVMYVAYRAKDKESPEDFVARVKSEFERDFLRTKRGKVRRLGVPRTDLRELPAETLYENRPSRATV